MKHCLRNKGGRGEKKGHISRETYVGFSATSGEIQVQGDPQVFKSLQVIAKAFSRKLPQGILVPLGCFFHLPFLKDTWRAKHLVSRRKPEGTCLQQLFINHTKHTIFRIYNRHDYLSAFQAADSVSNVTLLATLSAAQHYGPFEMATAKRATV